MKADNRWSERAQAPDPDDLSSDQPQGPEQATSRFAGKRHTDYTDMAHHEEIPDSRDSGDPSRPQGEFWHRNERPGAEVVETTGGSPSQPGESPLKVTPEALEGMAHEEDRPTIFFVDLRNKS
jgi:hypothetical protein